MSDEAPALTEFEALAVYVDDLAYKYGTSNTNFWLMFGAVLVFFMQAGFAMLEVGMVNIKNTKNILIKNVFDASIGALCWWAFGYGIATGTADAVTVVGDGPFFDDAVHDGAAGWLFGWAFAATAATIVSGAVAERVTFGCYIVYSIVLTTFIYPVVVHWGWGNGFGGAWRSTDLFMDCGVTDFAGSGVVHLCGACAALVGAIVVGPRLGRFDEGITLPQQSVVFQTLGTLILWMGWYGFNGASTLMLAGQSSSSSSPWDMVVASTTDEAEPMMLSTWASLHGTGTAQFMFAPFDFSGVAAHTMATTTLAAASCCLTTVGLSYFMSSDHVIDIGAANNGILAGLVSITAGCSTVEPWGAVVIGFIGAFWYILGCTVLEKFKIDDVVGAVPVHGFCGVWGVIAPGLFASEAMYSNAYYSSRAAKCAGLFMGGSGNMLVANLVFILAVIGWTITLSALLFIACKMTVGVRVTQEVEENGMDDSKHGGRVFSATPVPTQEV